MDENMDFTKEWEFSDIVFQFDDGSKVHANRDTLCQWSPVLKVMLTTKIFKESGQNLIQLPEKNSTDFVKLMEVLHPPTKPVTESSVYEVLPLSMEYQIENIKTQCESVLMEDPTLINMLIAERYDLVELRNSCLNMVKEKPLKQLRGEPGYKELNRKSLEKLLMCKYNELMCKYKELERKFTNIGKEHESLQNENGKLKSAKKAKEKRILDARRELQCYHNMHGYLDVADSHMTGCNFEGSSGLNPGGEIWNNSKRCDYCLCRKMENILK